VRAYRSGVQPFHHPLVGDLSLNYEAIELPADPGQTMVVYTAEPDSPAHEAPHEFVGVVQGQTTTGVDDVLESAP
jgi:hypothetical protein